MSDLLNFIVYVTDFIHLHDRVHGELLDLEVPQKKVYDGAEVLQADSGKCLGSNISKDLS